MIRVLIIDQVRLMCHVFAAVLEDEPDIEIVGCATSLDQALGQISRADVLLVSATMADQNPVELIREAISLNPRVKVLVVGLPESKEAILRFLEAGASGYVLGEDSLEILLENIRAVYHEQAHLSPEIAASLIARLAELRQRCEHDGQSLSPSAELSTREREILELVRHGLSNREIAEQLTIEVGTVKNHMHNILRKLNVKNRQEAAHYLA